MIKTGQRLILLQDQRGDARSFRLNNANGIGGAVNRDGIACRSAARQICHSTNEPGLVPDHAHD